MEVGPNGEVRWKENPVAFPGRPSRSRSSGSIASFSMRFADPQKIGKNEGSYDLVLDGFETELLKRTQDAA